MTFFVRHIKTSVVKDVISATACISTDTHYSSCTKAVLSLTDGLVNWRKQVRNFVSFSSQRTLLPLPAVYSSYPRSSNLIMSRRSSETSLAQGLELKAVLSKVEVLAPLCLAEDWDNVGLLIEPSAPHIVKNVFLCNDLTELVLEEAIEKQADLIISYHPPIFRPLKRLSQKSWKERIVVKCIEHRIALYSPHTASDAMYDGVNDWLASVLGPGKVTPVIPKAPPPPHPSMANGPKEGTPDRESTPTKHVHYKDYAMTREPTVKGKNTSAADQVLAAKEALVGMGRRVMLETPLSIEVAIALIKRQLEVEHVRICYSNEFRNKERGVIHLIKSVAVCAGSGASVLKNVDAGLILTGEMSHHEVLEFNAKGQTVILADHSNTERGYLKHVFSKRLHELLNAQPKTPPKKHGCVGLPGGGGGGGGCGEKAERGKELGVEIQVIMSEVDSDPLTVV